MRLAVITVLTSIVMQLLPGVSSAQYLSYRQSLWGDFEYTTDGIEFMKFGTGWPDLFRQVESDNEAYRLLKQSRNLNYAGQIFAGAGGVMLGYNLSQEANDREASDGIWIAGGVLALTSIVCIIAHKIQLDKGFLTYNRNMRGSSVILGDDIHMAITVTPRSAGLAFKF